MLRGRTRICGSDALLFVCYKLDLTHICHSNAAQTEKQQSVKTPECASIEITHLFLKITCQILVGGKINKYVDVSLITKLFIFQAAGQCDWFICLFIPPFNEFVRQQRIKYLKNMHPSFVFIHVRGVCTCEWIKQPFQNRHEVRLFYNSPRPDEITVY